MIIVNIIKSQILQWCAARLIWPIFDVFRPISAEIGGNTDRKAPKITPNWPNFAESAEFGIKKN